MKFQRALVRASLALACTLLLASCSGRLGWGVLLWSSHEADLPAGSVLPVYIRSNIEKVYVVGLPDSKEKIELPLWQIELFKSKRAAQARVAEFGEYLTYYLLATRDGLPIRETPNNIARRVYRLREGQSVKVLSKVEGEVVTSGGAPLAGNWFLVLTEDGAQGYVFSNTMRLYDERTERPAVATPSAPSSQAKIDLVFSRSWRPEYFQEMIDDGRLDLDLFSLRLGIFVDAIRRQIRIELPAASRVFEYSSIAEDGDNIVFEGTNLRIRFEGENRLVADWSGRSISAAEPGDVGQDGTGEEPGRVGASGRGTFVVIQEDLRDEIRAEEIRLQKLLDAFIDGGADWLLVPQEKEPETGGQELEDATVITPSSPPASRLAFSRGQRFSWTAITTVPQGYLSLDLGAVQDGTASGEPRVRLSLPPELIGEWEGSLSLRFDGARGWADFLYRHVEGRLELQPALAGVGLTVQAATELAPLVFEPAD